MIKKRARISVDLKYRTGKAMSDVCVALLKIKVDSSNMRNLGQFRTRQDEKEALGDLVYTAFKGFKESEVRALVDALLKNATRYKKNSK